MFPRLLWTLIMYAFHRFDRKPRNELTHREREVLGHVLEGRPNKRIADSLGISQRTVEVHRSRIFQKLGVRNAIELIASLYTRSQAPALRLAEPDAPLANAGLPPVATPTPTQPRGWQATLSDDYGRRN